MSIIPKCSILAALYLVTSPGVAAGLDQQQRFLVAQAEAPAPPEAQDPPAKATRRRKVVKKIDKPAAVVAPPETTAPPKAPVSPAPVAPAPIQAAAQPASPTSLIVSRDLMQAGASCIGHVEAIAHGALAGTKTFVAESSWRAGDAAKHMVGVMIGQSFGDGAKVPRGLTGIIAAPGQAGALCDAYTFQVMPSPLSCKEIQSSIEKNGKPAGDLGGLPLLRDAAGQVALLPGANGAGCVVVGFHFEY